MLGPLATTREGVQTPVLVCLSLCEAGNTLTDAPVSTKNRLAELSSTINNRPLSWPAAEAKLLLTTGSVVSRERTRWAARPGRVAESPVVEVDVGRSVGRYRSRFSWRAVV